MNRITVGAKSLPMIHEIINDSVILIKYLYGWEEMAQVHFMDYKL